MITSDVSTMRRSPFHYAIRILQSMLFERDSSLKERSKKLFDQVTKWAIELSEYNFTFQPCTILKSKVLADFIFNFTFNTHVQAEKELLSLSEHPSSKWTLSVDGLSNVDGVGVGLVLTSLKVDLIQQSIPRGFRATKNEAKYEALIVGLSLARDMGIKKLDICSNS